ncbi:MAG: ABC transporter ATP-binding protein [Pseudomonadota bacterium]
MTGPLIEFERVTKRFGDFTAVDEVSFAIERGEFIALMGPSGCGKTTSLRMLAGLETPDQGEIRINGERMNEIKANERDTPLVWQSLALFPFLNVQENVEFGLKMRGVDSATRRKKAGEWLDKMEIGEFAKREISQLSGGQRQRVALARALVTEPEVLLLDEPLSALDAHLVIRMQQVLTRLQKELGITFVYVTHSQSEAFAMADRVIIMGNGKIAQMGSAKNVYRSPNSRFVAEFVGRNNILSGTIAKTGNKTLGIETQAGIFHVPAKSQTQKKRGAPLSFSVSADFMTLHAKEPSAKASENVVPVTLISEEFIGSVVTLFFEGPNGTEFKCQIQERELGDLDLKSTSRFFLAWPVARSHILEDEA